MLFDAAIISPVFPGQEFLYDFVGLDSDLLTLAIWTILIEVPLFYFCGYREKRQLLYFAGVNLVSNLLLNGFFGNRGRFLRTGSTGRGSCRCTAGILPLLLFCQRKPEKTV